MLESSGVKNGFCQKKKKTKREYIIYKTVQQHEESWIQNTQPRFKYL